MTSIPIDHTDKHTHALPLSLLLKVFVGLIVLTVITVAVSRFDFGSMNIFIAMFIATIKVSLVALYFMHLRFDNKFYLIILLAALMFVFVFFFPTLLDVATRGIEDPGHALLFPPPTPGRLPSN